MTRSEHVAWLIRKDNWALAEGSVKEAPYIIRFRTPVLTAEQIKGYGNLLTIVWPYAPENSGELPDSAVSCRLAQFEDRFIPAFEHDAHAVLTAVLTFDGARQWVVYTGDIAECGQRISAMPQESERYPTELTTEPDPTWNYLRDKILSGVDYSDLS